VTYIELFPTQNCGYLLDIGSLLTIVQQQVELVGASQSVADAVVGKGEN
jgi:hypothetical protein